jgi:predicted HTH domain antitoxin
VGRRRYHFSFANKVISMTNIINLESLEDELKAVVQAGAYKSQEEAIRHALEVLLAANPHLRANTAVELYRRRQVTLSRAAEIAGLEFEALKERLAEQDIPIVVDESFEEVHSGAELIHRLRERS